MGSGKKGNYQHSRWKGSAPAVSCFFLSFIFSLVQSSYSQVQRFPANVTTVVAPPYSVYLSDYFAPGSRHFSGNVLFNDFNESSWTFRLKLTIQSTDIRLQTRPDFVASLPITVQPGVPYSLTGEDWEEYFDFNHLQASGRNINAIVRSGRLPEGMYSFCLQVLDYATGDPLSAEHCQNVWIQLMDPPRMISPACNTWVDPATATIQPFTWQLFNTGSANSVLGTEFRLTMWELTQAGANPLSAVANGQALQVFQSPRLSNTSYAYGPADPLLEAGKTYIYQVQALDPDGKDKFKNNGKSEFCYFNYGWPVGGSIGLVYPAEGGGFKRRDQKYIRWTSPNNMAPTQTITYEVDIKPVNKGQTPADALRVNKQWHYRKTPPTNRLYDQTDLIPQPAIEQGYAWQVKAFTGDQEVAQSKVGVFYGPSVVERFYAAGHRIEVDYLSVKDLNNLTGGGKVRLSKADLWTDITFSGLKLKAVDDYHVLEGGEITIGTKPIYFALSPRYEEDGEATLEATAYKINKGGLFVKGIVTWELPFAQLSNGKKKVVSEAIMSDFNDFQLSGTAPLARGNSFELLDPYGFGLGLSTDSKVHIINNVYHFEFRGTLTTPSVQTVAGTAAVWAFTNTTSLKYLEVAGTAASTPLRVIEGTGLTLLPGKGIIDLDEFTSPGRLSGNPQWKGVYMEELVLRLPEAIDTKGQFRLNEPVETTVVLSKSAAGLAHITAQGLTLKHTVAFGAAGTFGTFASTFTGLTLDITNQQVGEKSRLQGTFLVPFIDTAKPLNFEAQLFNRGFRAGTIAGVDNRSFRFNPNGGELALDLRIRKGEMVDNERLQLTIDVGWPALGVKLEGVGNFNIWGDHSVGFYTPEGIVALNRQVNATFRGYSVTIDALSAGRSKNYYGIAVSGKVVMGDDVSGDNGAPAFNLYSLAPNPLLSNDYTPVGKQVAISLEKATGDQQKLKDELAALEEDLTEQLQQQTASLESTTADLIASASASMGGEEYGVEEMVVQPAAVPETDFEAIQDPKERLLALIEYIKPFLDDPSAIDSFVAELQDVNDPTEAERTANMLLLIKKYAKQFAVRQVASLGDDFLQKVDKITYDVNAKITGEVNELTGKVHEEIDQAVGNLIATISADVIASISQQAPDAGLVVEEIANSTREAIVNEVVIAINTSVNQNLVFPLTTFISTNLSGRAHSLVQKTAEEVVFGLSGGEGPADVMAGVLSGFEDELAGLGGELVAQVDMDKLLSTIRSLGQDAVANISAKRIADNIKQGALEAIAGAVASRASEAASELANNLLGDEIGISIPLDFGAAGAKLLAGVNPKDLLFDPIPVKVRSPALDLNGIIHFTKAHPTFGDSWSGDVTAYVKVPKPFELKVAYLSGRKDGTSFWLAEVGGAVGSQSGQATDMNKVGGDMDGKMQDAPSGLQLGIIEVMALRGRVYHHMQGDELKPIVPNANTKYGAFLHMIMFGPNDGQRMRLEVNASMNTFASGDYTVSFDGNAQFMNKTPSVYQPDPNAVILAMLSLKYNSAEQHFYGFASAVVNKPGALCAEGSLLVDVKPGAWRVALGSRENKLRFIIACAGYGPTGWLDLNQNTAQLGLGLEFLFFTTIDLDVKLARVGLVIDAGANAGILTTVQYKPDFALLEAGLWLELWAKILLSYKLGPKEGSINLVDIYMAANATMRFHPAPTLLYGDVSGNIKVLFLNFGFNKQFTMNL